MLLLAGCFTSPDNEAPAAPTGDLVIYARYLDEPVNGAEWAFSRDQQTWYPAAGATAASPTRDLVVPASTWLLIQADPTGFTVARNPETRLLELRTVGARPRDRTLGTPEQGTTR